jgi:hypothetical protein
MMKNLMNSSEGWMTQPPMPLHRGGFVTLKHILAEEGIMDGIG